MNFHEKNEIIMCKAWISFAKRFNPEARIFVIHHDPIFEIQQFAAPYKGVRFIRLTKRDMMPDMVHGETDHPAQELKLSVWKQAAKLGIHKFLYVDSDAFILGSLATWWNYIDDKPFIAVNEQIYPYTPTLNAGAFSYNDASGFITYEKLMKQYQKDGNSIKIHAGDQGILIAYLREVGYDYTHPAIDFTYNCLAKWCQVKAVTDKEIVIFSGKFPLLRRIKKVLRGREYDWWERWAWWNRQRRVIILHAFGRKGYKFWELPECRPLWEYCIRTAERG